MASDLPLTDGLPVADPWFVRERVGDGITLVSEPHVHPLLRCNVWHVRGRDRDLVIDTSLGLAPLLPHVEDAARAAPDRARGDAPSEIDRPLLAVATHHHADHVGGLHEFAARAIHEVEAPTVATAGVASLVAEHFGPTVLDPYRDAGYEIDDLFVDAAPPGGIPSAVWEVPPAPATQVLREGDVLDCGDRAFEVLHLPGHSPGSIGLWEPATGVLFSGDAVYDGPLLDALEGSDVEAYVATMERLRRLPVSVVHGGHEPSFGRERLVAICDAYLRAN